ncbi:hypothetical protein SAMN05216480_104132 [Pustulibacterium marinum]|uniref:DUF1574 domain-containing protein n=1 Tax=Pustulibacterium marinum TaxID=1224947 RepID=A0A1I7GDP4_9FLAO|nr:hypothetical protein [Pustulibacterium marinum]SFU46553.1 hypothetical protein SAMN05216480_104132 [Pustulibacterium marinum]
MKALILKFLKQISIFAIIWGAIIYVVCLLLPYHYFNGEYPMWKHKMEIIAQKNSFNNLIIGDSRAIAGIDPHILGDSYYNLALGGGTPMEGFYQLKKSLQEGKKIDTLLISYAPIHFEQSEMFWDRQVKYNFYNLNEVEEIFTKLNTKNEIFWEYDGSRYYKESSESDYLWKAFFTHYKSPMTLRAELSKSLLLRGYSNYKIYDEIKARKGSYDFGKKEFSHELNVEAKRTSFSPKNIILSSLKETFKLAKENHITVIYVSLPMNKSSYLALKDKYRTGVLAMYGTLQTEYPEVIFKDNGLLYYEDKFFGDNSHLNKNGRERFSLETKKILQPNLTPTPNSLAINSFN